MDRYGDDFSRRANRNDSSWRVARRGYDFDARSARDRERPGTEYRARYDRDTGYDRGWGMTRMYRHMMRDRVGPYNPPLRGGTEFRASGRPSPAHRERYGSEVEGRFTRRGGTHAVGFIRRSYDRDVY